MCDLRKRIHIFLDYIYRLRMRKYIKLDYDINVSVKYYGNTYGGFNVCTDFMPKEGGVIYSFGVGEDLSFSQEMLREYDVDIFAFDPTPKAVDYSKSHEIYSDERFHFYSVGLSDKDEFTKFYLPCNKDYVSGSSCMRKGLSSEYITVEMKCLDTLVKELGHSHINILKMDIEGSEFKFVEGLRDKCTLKKLQIDQICLEVHNRFIKDGNLKLKQMDEILHDMGFKLVSMSSRVEELTYVSEKLLNSRV
ncbi:FkbM family methyltransferase [Selenomonas ruminantium]|uniref:Methyltransferase, FkbM family n=1 Tax=Selenomonas ruminantium TaxID=971 RepID=A0A1H3WP83_SELRU|nr:FkbM family methyltransferase [Selenomonas ruminantium]SDZ88943.1 methyltransferase, FkbM family [Selenomonas ruminantium]